MSSSSSAEPSAKKSRRASGLTRDQRDAVRAHSEAGTNAERSAARSEALRLGVAPSSLYDRSNAIRLSETGVSPVSSTRGPKKAFPNDHWPVSTSASSMCPRHFTIHIPRAVYLPPEA